MKETVHQKIEHTINSLDGLQRAEANPFLAAKIKRRLREETAEILQIRWNWKLAAVMTLIAILNLVALNRGVTSKTRAVDPSVVATEYSISLPEAY